MGRRILFTSLREEISPWHDETFRGRGTWHFRRPARRRRSQSVSRRPLLPEPQRGVRPRLLAAGVRDVGRGQGDQVERSRHPGIADGHDPGEGGQVEGLVRIFLDPLAALLDEEPHEHRAPESAPGTFHPLDALFGRQGQENLQIPRRFLLVLFDVSVAA